MKRWRTIPTYLWVGFSAAVMLALAIAASRASILAFSRQTENGSPSNSFSIQKDPKPIAKVPAITSGETPGSNSDTSGSTATNSASNTINPAVPLTKDSASDNDCDMNMDDVVSSYKHDVQKQKSLLDSTLSGITYGLNISSQYVTDYNNKVTTLFNQYQNDATNKHCTWPVKEPAVLPSTYTR